MAEVVGVDDDVSIAAITVAELLVGVELAGRKHTRKRQQFVEDVVATLPVEPYDLRVAHAHGALLAHARVSGRPRGAHDLIIAATAVSSRRTVVTSDIPGFGGLPGVAVLGV